MVAANETIIFVHAINGSFIPFEFINSPASWAVHNFFPAVFTFLRRLITFGVPEVAKEIILNRPQDLPESPASNMSPWLCAYDFHCRSDLVSFPSVNSDVFGIIPPTSYLQKNFLTLFFLPSPSPAGVLFLHLPAALKYLQAE